MKSTQSNGWIWSYELEMSWNNHTGATGGK
jgi:hypothetical protein